MGFCPGIMQIFCTCLLAKIGFFLVMYPLHSDRDFALLKTLQNVPLH